MDSLNAYGCDPVQPQGLAPLSGYDEGGRAVAMLCACIRVYERAGACRVIKERATIASCLNRC